MRSSHAGILTDPLARVLLVVLLLATAAIALYADTAAAKGKKSPHPLRTGVSFIWENDEAAFVNVRRTGSTLVQTPIPWTWVAPEEEPASWQPENPADPNYDWSHFDAWVIRAVGHGLRPVLQVRGAPDWAQRCPIRISNAPCDPDPSKLAAFTTAAVRRYSGHFGGLPWVRYWQGLNEPNLSLFFNPQYIGDKPVSAELFRTLINTFYDAVKAVNPSNVVIAGGLGPTAIPPHTIGPLQFTRELLCMKGRNQYRPLPGDCHGGVKFDIFDIHPYTTGGPTHEGGPNDVQAGSLGRLTELLAAADRAGRIHGVYRRTPLWITEFSWDSNPPDPAGLPMAILNRWTVEALHNAWRAGVSDFFWFSLRDYPRGHSFTAGPTLESGLFFRGPSIAEDQPKEVLSAFRFPFLAYPGPQGLVFWGRTPTSRGGKVSIQIQVGGKWRGAFATRASKNGIFLGVVPGSRYGRKQRGSARAVYRGERSVPFSMKPVPDFPQPPFGGNVD